jgi:hypothetical protein
LLTVETVSVATAFADFVARSMSVTGVLSVSSC